MPRTRILSTIGPASSDLAVISAMLAAGADAFRLNFSHGTLATHQEMCRRIRQAAQAVRRDVAIVQDLGGPKIRIGELAAPLRLETGATLVIERGDTASDPGQVSCSFDALFTSVVPGHRLLVDDGTIELEVTDVALGRITTRVITPGVLQSHKGINVPGVRLRTSALTPKDVDDLRAGIAMGVDLVALSFVQSPDDLTAARTVAASAGAADLPIIAKIEKPQAVEQIDEILQVADGIMVARGDLGIEVPLETLPAVQKRLIRAARQRGVPVIVATQVLESMRSSPRPTRAEVTDAAHAVDEGVDAIMLAGETAVGQYPVRAVETLDAIMQEAERFPPAVRIVPEAVGVTEHGRALCEAAVAMADRARASAIVALTSAGKTARTLAALRPAARILAATPSAQTAARLSLVWGVTPLVIDPATLGPVRDEIVNRGLVPPGAVVVFVSMHSVLGREETNFVHVERV
jgi:pyruvate kinase